MSVLSRAREVTGDIAAVGKRQVQRGKLEVEVRRLESKVGEEKNVIGHALYPLLDAGTVQLDDPEVQTHMSAIADLLLEITEKKDAMDALKLSRARDENRSESIRHIDTNATAEAAAQQSARDAWANQGGTAPEQGGQG